MSKATNVHIFPEKIGSRILALKNEEKKPKESKCMNFFLRRYFTFSVKSFKIKMKIINFEEGIKSLLKSQKMLLDNQSLIS